MPQMTWEGFEDAHHRPNLVIAKVQGPDPAEKCTAMFAPFGTAMVGMMRGSPKKCILDLNQSDFLGVTSKVSVTIDCKILAQP
jgi:hypothetical protein